MTFYAKYPGRCASCEDRIHEGDAVTYADDELVHAACDGPTVDRDGPVCGQCFTIHAGECM